MNKFSAGILVYKFVRGNLNLLLAHPGGPFFAKKDLGAWSVPKGEFIPGEEDPFTAAIREFFEETGFEINGDFIPLSSVKLKNGKTVYAWALEKELDPGNFKSNTFKLEWPPKSGKYEEFHEIDRLEWFNTETAKKKINAAQTDFIDELEKKLYKIQTHSTE